jgi:uncharacterized protein YdaU (DUF1376 family)
VSREDRPYIPWYYKDWLTSPDRFSMTYEQRGVYRDLLDFSWDQRGLPTDKEQIRNFLGLEKRKFALVWPEVSKHFVEQDGRLVNLKQERVRAEMDAKRREKQEAGSKGGKRRAERLAEAKQNGSSATSTVDDSVHNPQQIRSLSAENLRENAAGKPGIRGAVERNSSANGADGRSTATVLLEAESKPSSSSSLSSSNKTATAVLQQQPWSSPRRADRAHAGHVFGFCEFKCISEEKANEFARDLPRGLDDPKNFERVIAWAQGVKRGWGDKPKLEATWWEFWQARWREYLDTLKASVTVADDAIQRQIAESDARRRSVR